MAHENVLGIRLKQLRKKFGYNQIQLSKLLNISNTTLSQYESGVRVPSDDIKVKISEIFNVSVDFLLGNKAKEVYRYEKSLSPKQLELLEQTLGLPDEDIDKILEYTQFIKSKHKT